MKKKNSKLEPVDILVLSVVSGITILGAIFLILGLS